jgi:hypothetical protein
MEMEDAFRLAQSDTRFIKVRKNLLYTFGITRLPYICLSQSSGNADFIVIRRGEVTADKPQIALPGENFSFDGFEGAGLGGETMAVVLARHISLPPSKYINKRGATVHEHGPISEAINRIVNRLENDNDVRTAVITAPDQVWNLSVLLYAGSQVARSAPANVQEHFEHMRFQNGG